MTRCIIVAETLAWMQKRRAGEGVGAASAVPGLGARASMEFVVMTLTGAELQGPSREHMHVEEVKRGNKLVFKAGSRG